jgi:KipI family sensor histidine kinase inhibitor
VGAPARAGVTPMGPHAVLIDAAGRRPAAVAAAIRGTDGVVDVVVGAASVLVVGTHPEALARAVQAADRAGDGAGPDVAGPVVEIAVTYDGPDLEDVAARSGLSVDEVVAAHSGADYEVAFVGFAPGFGYLHGLPPALHLPRRPEPRSRVPAGAVAIADTFSAVYPRATPGGWHLLGRTSAVLFDPARRPPALLGPGTRVRFVPTELAPGASGEDTGPDGGLAPGVAGGEAVEVLDAGGRTTTQDAGRPGRAAEGVPPSGAADRSAARLANRLVGNDEGDTVLETTLAGPTLRLAGGRPRAVAVTGPPGPVSVDGTPRAGNAPFDLRPGQVLAVGAPRVGLRRYVAVSGGFAVEKTLGSASSDALTGLGPSPLGAGDRLALGPDPGRRPGVDVAPVPERPTPVRLRAGPGPHHDWLTEEGAEVLGRASWAVASSSDRVGVRLDGPELGRARSGEVPSLGLVRGAVQLTPSGQLVVFGPDHPVTGGYPVVAVVDPLDLDLLAQLRPGEQVRLAVG